MHRLDKKTPLKGLHLGIWASAPTRDDERLAGEILFKQVLDARNQQVINGSVRRDGRWSGSKEPRQELKLCLPTRVGVDIDVLALRMSQAQAC